MRELRGVVNRLKRTEPRTEHYGTSQVREDEAELCGGIPTVDVRDEIYEVNHCSAEEMPNQVERRRSGMEWSRVSKASDRSSRQRQDTCCMEKRH